MTDNRTNKLSLPTAILISSVILGCFLYIIQLKKQNSIERQQNIKIQEERLITCLEDAKENWGDKIHKKNETLSEYIEVKKRDKILEEDKDYCYKNYEI